MKASGFSLIELVVALGLTLVVTAAIFDLVAQSRRSFDTEPDAMDRQQRIRVAVDALQHDLLTASAVMPYRAAAASPDPPGSFKDDVVTIVSQRAAQADTVRTYYLRRDATSGSAQLMRAEGGGGDAPVVDGLTTLSFAYFGDPAGSVDDECRVTPGGGVLVPIAGSEFTDGPWCPPAAGVDPVDADLSRVRTVVVRVGLRNQPGALSFEVALRNRNQDR
jgi:type II secretory pathway pseudopilin PulG